MRKLRRCVESNKRRQARARRTFGCATTTIDEINDNIDKINF